MSRVTIQDIAARLGISKFAVSRALSGKSGVSETTRREVFDQAQALGYLSRRRTRLAKNIMVVFKNRSTASRELWIDVQNGIDHEADACNMTMSVRRVDDPADLSRLVPEALGFILVGPHSTEVLEATLTSAVPAVVVNHVVPALWQKDQVSAADFEAGVFVAHRLHAYGHRKVVYAHGILGYPGRLARLNGFSEAISEIGGMQLRAIGFSDDQAADDLRGALADMVAADFEPTAFFCGSDTVAVTVLSELMRLGLRVPEDVSVVGHADYAIATRISPQLTTIHMPHREMGMAAARILLARAGRASHLDGLPPQRVNLVPKLIERQSSGIAPTTSWRQRLRGALPPRNQ